MERVKTLVNVKVGDKFIVKEWSNRRKTVVECERVTPKQAKIGRFKYRLDNADSIGGDSWSRPPQLYVATPEIFADIALAQRREYLKHGMKTDALTDDQVNRIFDILNEVA